MPLFFATAGSRHVCHSPDCRRRTRAAGRPDFRRRVRRAGRRLAGGQWLKRKKGAGNAVIANLNARIYAWWLMTLVLLAAFWFGKTGAVVLFFLISFAALREFMTLIYRRRCDYYSMAACFYVLLPVQYWLVWREWYGLFAIFIPMYGFLLLPIITGLSGQTEDFLARAAKTQWMAMICIFCLSHVPALMFLHLDGFNSEKQHPAADVPDCRGAGFRRAAIHLGQADRRAENHARGSRPRKPCPAQWAASPPPPRSPRCSRR